MSLGPFPAAIDSLTSKLTSAPYSDHRRCVRPYADIVYSMESCRRALHKRPQERSAQDIKFLLQLIRPIRFFQQLPRRMQESLCRVILLEEYDAKEVVFREGDASVTPNACLARIPMRSHPRPQVPR